MPREQKTKPFNKYEYEQSYIHESYKWINVQFNRNKPEEMRLYEWVKSRKESQAMYIKRLIAKDMGAGK